MSEGDNGGLFGGHETREAQLQSQIQEATGRDGGKNQDENNQDPTSEKAIESDTDAKSSFTQKAYDPQMQGIYEHRMEISDAFYNQFARSDIDPDVAENMEHLLKEHLDDLKNQGESGFTNEQIAQFQDMIQTVRENPGEYDLETSEPAHDSQNPGVDFQEYDVPFIPGI